MGKRGQKPKGKVKIKWSANFAYAIGLIATDGCLSKNSRHILFVSMDKEQIDNYMKALGIKNRIGRTMSGYSHKKAYRVQFSDVLFYKFLLEIGLAPAKSLTIKQVAVPKKYFFDFVRGCFDGDGCSYSYWDPRWKSSFMFYLSFASGSVAFVAWLQSMIAKLSNLYGHVSVHRKKGGKNNYYQLKYSKYEAMKLVRLMYKNKNSIKLMRKYLKIMKSLDIVRKHKGRVFVK
jgi:hypothetical protein